MLEHTRKLIEGTLAIEAKMSRGTDGGWLTRWGGGPLPARPGLSGKRHMEIRCDGDSYGTDVISAERDGDGAYIYMTEDDATGIAHARNKIAAYAKALKVAMEALQEAKMYRDLSAKINAALASIEAIAKEANE